MVLPDLTQLKTVSACFDDCGKDIFCERGLGKSMLIAFITVNCGHDVHCSCLLSYSHRENSYSVALVVKIEKVFLLVKKYPSFCCQCPKNEPKYLEFHVKLSLYHFYSLLMEVHISSSF